VVENADWVVVELIDGRTFDAQLLGADTATDIAVLSIEADNLPQVELGKSSSLRVGDLVLAVGNPFGIGQTVTSGIVSALGRGLSLEGFEDFIQTDAAVNPGNSGGALVDMEGRVVGLCTAIIGPGANIGIAFAVPIDLARAVMEQLVEFGEMRRPRVGIELVDLSAAMIADLGHGGAMVYRTTPGSAAALAGLKAGDVISHVNGVAVRDARDLSGRLGVARVGDRVALTVRRGSATLTLELRLNQALSAA
jgi:S1-C subfamily serine protease